jgi:hypothetical protein
VKKLILMALFCASSVSAGVLDDLKTEAAVYGLTYYRVAVVDTSDGKTYYVFGKVDPEIIVAIPTDITNYHDAFIAFQAGYNSARLTGAMVDVHQHAPPPKAKKQNEH